MRTTSYLTAVLLLAACAGPGGATDPAKTTFQTSYPWRGVTDIRADAVMVYGTGPEGSLEQRLASWRERGYTAHFMTGIAWGGYADYFTGAWDGRPHWDEGQVEATGDTLWHGKDVPYIVPTENYLDYFKETQIKRAIDAGADDLFLEEPEFWARGGYSDAFKREWEAFYGTPWRPQDESPEATWLSSRLKYQLYYRALDEAFRYAKEYGRSLGREIRCYVPTHSLINYSQWQIVSPEASLASLPCVDGYIAQVWTGTSRVLNHYRGVAKERVFETAFLEYGCMVSMTAPTGRRLWLLTDPIEDRPRDWEDFRRNYQATFTAQLLYPQVADYEVMPWPDRIFDRPYPVRAGSSETALIPGDYASMVLTMTGALQQMPAAPAPKSRFSVLMGNSLMFQAFPEHEGYDDPQLAGFFGLAMPLLKRGERVGITHIENLGYPKALEGVEVLLMTYSNMKPLDPQAHRQLADWVRGGGKLIYSATDTDPFQRVQEWWNSGYLAYSAPSDHLFELLGVEAGAPEGSYSAGRGTLQILRHDPKEFVLAAGGETLLLDAVEALSGALPERHCLTLDRGPYRIVAVLDEGDSPEPYVAEGCFIDLYDPALPVYGRVEVAPGSQALYYDVRKAGKAPKILAAGGRSSDERRAGRSFRFVVKGPERTVNVTRILLPAEPVELSLDGVACPFEWDGGSRTVLLRIPNRPDGTQVHIRW